MTALEIKAAKQKYYTEALRYMDNAKETLRKAGKEDNMFKDEKYVKTASGIAYNAVLVALDGLFYIKNVAPPKNRRSKEYYQKGITKVDNKLNSRFHTVYNVLHLDGYYDGIKSVKIINGGFEIAYEIIEKIKP